MIEPSYVHITRAGYDAVAADYSEWVSDDLAAKPLDRALLGQPVVISEKSSFYAICAGQQGSPEVALEQ